MQPRAGLEQVSGENRHEPDQKITPPGTAARRPVATDDTLTLREQYRRNVAVRRPVTTTYPLKSNNRLAVAIQEPVAA